MAIVEYETEEQELEALKRWLKENGPSLVIGLVLGVGGLFGWRYYLDYKTDHSAIASDRYQTVLQQVSLGQADEYVVMQADQLRSEFADTPYAVLVSFAQAKYEHSKGNDEQALMHLDWAMKNAATPEMEHTARLRIARILLAQKKLDEAGSILEKAYPVGFTAGYEELKGDLYIARGDIDQAKVAYDKAIGASTSDNRWLRLKRQELGEPAISNVEQNEAPAVKPPA
jgi:predicted negative regulator of RcsB-dependent stress response